MQHTHTHANSSRAKTFNYPTKKRKSRKNNRDTDREKERVPSDHLFFSLCLGFEVAVGDLEGTVMPVKETFLGMQLEHRAGSKNLATNLSVPPRRKSSWRCDAFY